MVRVMFQSKSGKNRLKFKTSRNLPIILEESIEYTQMNESQLEDANK